MSGMNNDKREVRNTNCRASAPDADKRTVEGYALLFDVCSDGLGFDEIIDRKALDGVIARSDVFALLNHDRERGLLARCKNGAGSLELVVDDKGLMYRFEAPRTNLGDELLENLRRGEIDQSSFSFTVEDDKWIKCSDGRWMRTILKIDELYDVSPVYNAAYSATSVYLRGREAAEKEMEERAELEAYYKEVSSGFGF